MATERQIAANRANSQKSTGPKSSAGKEKSRANAYRHGCKALVVIRTENPEAVEAERAEWIAALAPRNVIALKMADVSYQNYRRLQHVSAADDAATAERVIEAERRFGVDRRRSLNEAVASILDDPMVARSILATTVEGCRTLADQLGQLAERLNRGSWNRGLLDHLLAIEGKEPAAVDRRALAWIGDLEAYQGVLRQLSADNLGLEKPAELVEYERRGPMNPHCDSAAEIQKARKLALAWERLLEETRVKLKAEEEDLRTRGRAAISGFKLRIQEDLREVEAIQAGLADEEAAARRIALDKARFDETDAGKLRRRYVAESQRDLIKSLKAAEDACGTKVRDAEPRPEAEGTAEEGSPNEANFEESDCADHADSDDSAGLRTHPNIPIPSAPTAA